MDDELVFDAVSMRLSAAIEELSGIDESTLLDRFGDTWFEIKATRNVIAHNYTDIDAPQLESTVANELSGFVSLLVAMRDA